MAKFRGDDGKLHDLDSLEQGKPGTPAREIVQFALELASHTKAFAGRAGRPATGV